VIKRGEHWAAYTVNLAVAFDGCSLYP